MIVFASQLIRSHDPLVLPFAQNLSRPALAAAALLGALLVLGVGLELLNPQIVRGFIDTRPGRRRARVPRRRAAMLYIGIALVGQIVAVADTYLAESVGQAATNALRADLTSHCLDLDMPFHDARTPGEMIERVDGDVAALANFFSRFVLSLGASALMLIGVLVLLYREDWRIGVVFTVLSAVALARDGARPRPGRSLRARQPPVERRADRLPRGAAGGPARTCRPTARRLRRPPRRGAAARAVPGGARCQW